MKSTCLCLDLEIYVLGESNTWLSKTILQCPSNYPKSLMAEAEKSLNLPL